MHKPDYLKFSIADGESIVIKKSYVKYVNVESDDMGYSRAAVIYFTEKGDEEIYKVLARNIGKFISLYYGDKLIRGNVKIMEAYKLGRIGVLIENEKDEALVIDIMRTYKERKGAGQ